MRGLGYLINEALVTTMIRLTSTYVKVVMVKFQKTKVFVVRDEALGLSPPSLLVNPALVTSAHTVSQQFCFTIEIFLQIQILSDPQVWLDAATQIFFSLGIGFGGVIAFASYNPKKQDCQRDSLIIALTNSGTSILASIVIFAILGYKATVQYETCLDG